MSVFCRALPWLAELLGFGLIAAALWFVSLALMLAFIGVCLVVGSLIFGRRK